MTSRIQPESTSPCGKLARVACAVVLAVFLLAPSTLCFAQPAMQQGGGRPRPGNPPQTHLGPWLQRHGNLLPQQQERALQSEPGFTHLNPETQQRLVDRLHQINRMPPPQRQRTLDRIEAMERLSPQARQQVQSSVQGFHALPQDRQRMVRKAFRDLREYPPEQRGAMMRSPQFQSQFSPYERGMMNNLLSVEPYRPMRGPAMGSGLENGH